MSRPGVTSRSRLTTLCTAGFASRAAGPAAADVIVRIAAAHDQLTARQNRAERQFRPQFS